MTTLRGKFIRSVLASALVLTFLAGCTGKSGSNQSGQSQPQPPAQTQAPKEKVLNLSAGNMGTENVCDLTTSLYAPGAPLVTGKLVLQTPDLSSWVADQAESWDSPDAKTWTIHLRKGLKWHDGQPFTAKDVVFSLNLVTNPKTGSIYGSWFKDVNGFDDWKAGKADKLAGVTVVDDTTVQIALTTPSAAFVANLSTLTVWPEHALGSVKPEEICKSDFWTTTRIGTGPYKWSKYLKGQRTELVANPAFWRGKPKIDKVNVHIFASDETALAAFEKGDLDHTAIPVTSMEYAQKLQNANIVSYRSMTVRALYPNEKKPEFSDPRVRQAMAYAIDRNAVIKNLAKGTYRASFAQFPQDWTIPSDLNQYPYNPEKAKQLLKDAGWKGDKEYELMYYYRDQDTINIMTFIKTQLAAVGMKVNPVLVDSPTLRSKIDPGNFDMFYGASGGADPDSWLTQIGCDWEPMKGNNTARYCNKELDDLMQQGHVTTDTAKRKEIYQKAAHIQNQDQALVYLWEPQFYLAVNKRVTGSDGKWAGHTAFIYNAIETWDIKQ